MSAKENLYVAELFAKSLVESAINSFQIDNPKQTIFNGEIDIMYPPNYEKFMSIISSTNDGSIRFLEGLLNVIKPHIHFYVDLKEALPALQEAGEMTFGKKS